MAEQETTSGERIGEPNPIASALNVTVSVPETIEIKMVDASVLSDYEVWFFISSVISSAFFGFLVAFLQDTAGTGLGWMTLLIFILFSISMAMTLSKRKKLDNKSKTVPLQVTSR